MDQPPQVPVRDSLKQQLENSRLERALEIAESLAEKRALLTTAELTRLNNVLRGKEDDPWREAPVTLLLPSGRQETYSLIADPIKGIREKLHLATESAENGHVLDAVVTVYAGLVRMHAFKDANRRTAAVAAHFFLCRYGVKLSGRALHDLGLGDVREEAQLELLKTTLAQMMRFAEKRSQHE